jgi:hypothetical protein
MTVLSDRVRAVMESHWQPEGYTVPNAVTYPFRWLWDSCFHALVWAELGEPERAVSELAHVLQAQDDRGFVPHIDYGREPSHHEWFWGRSGRSTITQPPMYGHAVAALRRRGIDVGDDLVERARAGIQFFLRERRHPSGLIAVMHPWETGCDDSPRFDHWGAGDPKRWYDVKGALVAALPDNGFDCAPVSLSALVAWNGRELDLDTADLVDAIAARWDREQCTWIDGGESENTSGRVRTLEALLPLLVVEQPDALAAITDSAAFGGAFGPAGVHRAEPAFDRRRYWRGPVWPQLAYLLWLSGAPVAETTVRGAETSGLSEFWDPDDGTGLGASPQSWTCLAVVMSHNAADTRGSAGSTGAGSSGSNTSNVGAPWPPERPRRP